MPVGVLNPTNNVAKELQFDVFRYFLKVTGWCGFDTRGWCEWGKRRVCLHSKTINFGDTNKWFRIYKTNRVRWVKI